MGYTLTYLKKKLLHNNYDLITTREVSTFNIDGAVWKNFSKCNHPAIVTIDPYLDPPSTPKLRKLEDVLLHKGGKIPKNCMYIAYDKWIENGAKKYASNGQPYRLKLYHQGYARYYNPEDFYAC